MKKFFCIMPTSVLESHVYEAVGNKQLFNKDTTRFPLTPLLTGYTESNEEIQVIAITATGDARSEFNVSLLEREIVNKNRSGKVTMIAVDFSAADGSLELLTKLIPLLEDGDHLYVCLHFASTTVQFAIISALQYAYRALRNVSIECVCTQGESGKYQNVDITALVHAGELLQTLTERHHKDPAKILRMTLALGEEEDEGEE